MRYHHKLQLNLSTALLLATAPTALHAQAASGGENAAARPADAGGVVMDEIIVTAQKRSERLIDVPMSITAASGEQLAKQGITETAQLAKLVPGFTYQQSNYGNPVFAIRGIGFVEDRKSVVEGKSVSVR